MIGVYVLVLVMICVYVLVLVMVHPCINKCVNGRIQTQLLICQQERLDGVTETQLFMRQVKMDSFKPYVIVAGNGVAIKQETVFLKQSKL